MSRWMVTAVLALAGSAAVAQEIAPAQVLGEGKSARGRFSERTVTVAVELDRDGARLIAFTFKDRPFERPLRPQELRINDAGGAVSIDFALLGPGLDRYRQRIEVRGLCLDHAPDAPAHVQGDTVRLHRESVLVEVPEIAGFDRIEVSAPAKEPASSGPASLTAAPGIAPAVPGSVSPAPGIVMAGSGNTTSAAPAPLGVLTLSSDRFTPAGGKAAYADLLFGSASASPAAGPSGPLTTGAVHWPEEFGDPDRYVVYGSATEAARRINIVIVPDGYTYAEKGTMQAHAQALVTAFRSRTPYAEHDRFLNYTLVYAYSTESGTDQCDCSIVKDTAMATRFPLQTTGCQHSDNRCLYYGIGNGGPNCDPNTSTANIAAAELRAPVRDATLIMVNTTRYGGCGGSRAVYSAGNGAATEIAIHELGHSLAGLADEYAYDSACGSSAGEVNTSSNPATGAWAEWIPDIGPPWEGAQYYGTCLYRPKQDCVMRALGYPFCPVCNQQWSLVFFGWYRVFPTAPIESSSPPVQVSTPAGVSTEFSIVTRLATGTTNDIIWRLEGPGYPVPTEVATGSASYSRSFAPAGDYILTCEVIADTNFVKPERNAANVDLIGWSVHAQPIPEVSDDPVHQLVVEKSGAAVNLRFEDVGASNVNVYVSRTPVTSPFAVGAPESGKKDCAVPGVTDVGGGMQQISGYSLDAGLTGDTSLLFILVTADNGPASESSLGSNSVSIERTADSYCNR